MSKKEETEGNVKYIINYGGSIASLHVENMETKVFKDFDYTCIREPIWGYDWEDVRKVNIKLDEMINSIK